MYEKLVKEMTNPNRKKGPSQEIEMVRTITPTQVLVATETPYVRFEEEDESFFHLNALSSE